MKSKRLVGLLALASCVILAGCGGNDPKPDPKPDPVPVVVEISVLDLPNLLLTGESLDLDEYVTVRNAASWSVSLSEASNDLASLEGHVITVTGEGEIEFTITAGDKTKTCVLNAESEVRYRIREHVSGMGHKYIATCSDSDILHGEGFIWQDVYDYQTGAFDYGFGFVNLSSDSEVYYYGERSEGEEDYEYEFNQQIYSYDSLISYYNCDFDDPDYGINVDELPMEYVDMFADEGEEGEYMLAVEGADLENLLTTALFLPTTTLNYLYTDSTYTSIGEADALKAYLASYNIAKDGEPANYVTEIIMMYGFGRVDMELDEYGYIDENSGVVVDDPVIEGVYDVYTILNAKNGDDFAVIDASLEEMAGKDEYAPEAFDFCEFAGVYDTFEGLMTAKTFTVDYMAGWVDDEGNPIEAPDLEGYIFDGIFPEEPIAESRVVSGTGFFEGNEDGPFYGLVDHEGATYDLYPGEVMFEPVLSDFESAWDDKASTLQVLNDSALYPADLCYDGEAFLAGMDGENPVFGYMLSLNMVRQDAFLKTILSTNSSLAVFASSFDAVCEEYGANFWNYIESSLVSIPDYGFLALQASFVWDDGVNFTIDVEISYYPGAASVVDLYANNFVNWPVAE